MKRTPLPNLHCPRCGKPNQCAPAKSGSFDTPCWCTNITVNPDVIATLGGRRDACLCHECAQAAD
jgi:hypothetical protein